MFSAYSWGDYIKFVSVCLIVYYAFVAYKYYRHDIIEWLGNRGQKPQPAVDEPADEEDPDDGSLYTVSQYLPQKEKPTTVPESRAQTEALTPVPADLPPPQPYRTTMPSAGTVELPEEKVLDEDPGDVLELPLTPEIIRPKERSLSEVLNAASRVKPDEKGVLTPNDPDDAEAAELAEVINVQQGFSSALSGVSFNR